MREAVLLIIAYDERRRENKDTYDILLSAL